jgi:phosphatidylserine/phosphatidylglycerophosphate/cardiolipin synthase-like enzyme
MTELILNEAIYGRIVEEEIPAARKFLWIITADLKDMHVIRGKRSIPFLGVLGVLAELVERGVAVRLIHAKEPGPMFRKDFDRYPSLIESDLFERALCPRVHTKAIIIDGKRAFITSANLTGAGLGAKHADKRNFEAGILTDERKHIAPLMEWADELFLGEYCARCRLRSVCPDPLDNRE